ncbi:putative lysine-specific demethylase JMJ16 [Mercurialis annua]|uniref:putative lysine-specific demethylase JMJ16 n=1 Tax=Mercurialis annua TaxID=3986 RepID=UPI00215E9C35|nr:putative lysine-specific demethylase JMJ16 [Mercurialis annua]XP_050221875.1 putative lysine-specific demethylase JMJ16 [Mercurialis annua]
MGTELMRVCVKEENDDIPAVPPGFESFAAFTLKKVQDSEKQESLDIVNRYSGSLIASESQPVKMETEFQSGTEPKVTRSLRRRAWINYGQLENCSGEEAVAGKLIQDLSSRPHLPKGVIRGCEQCIDCQKVNARWHPGYARKPELEDAPVFYPTEEEFEDTLNYIASIRPKAEQYGICRIVPPPSWKPPCPLKEKSIWEGSKFATRVQRVDKLQNRDSLKKMSRTNNHTRKKRRKCMRMEVDCGTDTESISGCTKVGACEADNFGFEPGPQFTLNMFQKYADDFKAQYFGKNDVIKGVNTAAIQDSWEPTVENIEGEYWRIVEKATEEIEVLYGADLETGVFGSGFPKLSSQVGSDANDRYAKSGWNLNNFPRLPGSVLSYESGDISGVLVPWLYIGMCFSSFCWHVEDHHLYSLNYLHWGAPKIWYGVPGKDSMKLEEAMRKHLPDLFDEQPDLLHKLVTQLSPSILKAEGIPVYRCKQNSGEFILTFPRAYHSGFNCGFNCAEAVNVAPVDWLPHGQIAIELYREQGRRTSISHDKLLLGASREAVRAHWELNLLKKNTSNNLRWKEVCGKDGILSKALKERVEMERVRREFLCKSSQALKMDSNFDATSERECNVCLFDLHLSAAGCHCSPDKYACLNHTNQMCSCGGGTKYFLFRYDINELNILVEALEGKLSAVYRWARLDLGLALASFISKDNLQDCKLSYLPEVKALKETRSKASLELLNDLNSKTSIKILNETPSVEKKIPPETIAQKVAKALALSNSSFQVIEKQSNGFKVQKEGSTCSPANLTTAICQLSREDTSYAGDVSSVESGSKKPPPLNHGDIILLSDDEGDEPKESAGERTKENSHAKHSEVTDKPSSSNNITCNDNKDTISITSLTDSLVSGESNGISSPSRQRINSLFVPVKLKDVHQESERVLESNASKSSCHPGSASVSDRTGQDSLNMSQTKRDQNMLNSGCQPMQQLGSLKPNAEDKMGASVTSNSVEYSRAITASPSCSSNNLDRHFRQKGPRIAKVVRRINCNVEPLEFGDVLSGKLWSNSQAIFPKGFRSRVRYISVLDPTNMSYYVSEILGAGQDRPLFMVSLEDCPSEVFVHVSASRCWEMVRDRVNQEITKQHKLGRMNLPPLQPPGSLDGLEMFGFSSPAIVQAIEALDRNRVCTDYWDLRPYSRPVGQIPQPKEIGRNLHGKNDGQNGGNSSNHSLPNGADNILRELLKKANTEELNSLNVILNGGGTSVDGGLITKLVNEEIKYRRR